MDVEFNALSGRQAVDVLPVDLRPAGQNAAKGVRLPQTRLHEMLLWAWKARRTQANAA